VTTAELRSLPERLQNSDTQITDDLHVVALTDDEYEAVMLFVNHSCQPNVGFAGNVVLVAMRDVDPGEELTTDYAMFDDYEGSMDCTCGRPACRRVVDGRDWQRPDLQERYRGDFSWYLQRRMEPACGLEEVLAVDQEGRPPRGRPLDAQRHGWRPATVSPEVTSSSTAEATASASDSESVE
jgi:hypothetical protein